MNKKLFLLDAMALIYRAYYALVKSPRVTSKGQNTSAIFGFTNILLELLNKEKPTHIAVAFDTHAPTERETVYSEYKAHRQATPEDIIASVPYIKKILEGFGIPVLECDGFEADDVIGTLAKKAEKHGYETYMVTSDKDFGQLVSDKTFMFRPPAFKSGWTTLREEDILKRWEIKNVAQVKDILGLMGDSADNIPGVPGVGEKTAIKLVNEFGSVEGVIKNADKLKGKLQENVRNFSQQALLSKQLATIHCEVPVKWDEEDLIISSPNKEMLSEIFNELEFRTIAKRVLGETFVAQTSSVSIAKTNGTTVVSEIKTETTTTILTEEPTKILSTIKDIPHTYHLVDTKEKRKKLIAELSRQKSICFDTETTGTDAHNVELVGISFSFKPTEAYYIPVPENYNEAQAIVNEFKEIFENEKIEKSGQNIKYDMSVLKWYDIEIKGKLFDTMIAHYLIQPDMRHNMNILAETYLHYSPVSIETLIGKKGKGQLSMRAVPTEQICEYAAEDADITLQLGEKFMPMLKETETKKLFEEVEMPLVPVLSAMESEGVKIDISALKELSSVLANDIVKSEKEIYSLAGKEFNISSPKQVGEILFEELKIAEKSKKTKTGQHATSEDILEKLKGTHPIIDKILDYRELQKLKNTYVDTLPELVNPRTGRVHTTYSQIVAVTGRLSSDNPNLQNIPIRTERGREIRKAFVPRNNNFTLLSADYSQVELRVIAALSEDENMIEAFKSGNDIHSATASKVYNVPIDNVNSDMRRNAKMVNFGIIYGISAFGLAQRLNIPRTEAKGIIDTYFAQYPKIKEYMNKSIELAKEKGYVETILGRRRYLRDINSSNHTVRGFAERNAINAPIQGSAADMIKIAMINIQKEFQKKKFKSKMILQVHDELVFDVHKDEIEDVKPLVEDKMKHALKLSVPIEVEAGTGSDWLSAH
ncbi:MAG: DNA polymerase I [Bacteroidetes bacterium]|nr:DNA polymerase I [Bacteroidota bacterium]